MLQPQQSIRMASLFLAGLWLSPAAFAQEPASTCSLLPMEQQLQISELRADLPQYAEINYRKKLIRYVNTYYSNIAEDLLRGNGEYLNALHRLMGSSDKHCDLVYKQLLLQEVNSQDFGMALWLFRVESVANTQVSNLQPCQECNMTDRKIN